MAGKDKLTQRQIETAKPKNKPYRLADGAGLFLLVSVHGGKSWQKRYKSNDGIERIYSIGTFPQVSLKEARAANFELARQLRGGIDPMAEKQAIKRMERLERENGKSLTEVGQTWLASRAGAVAQNTLNGDRMSLAHIEIFFAANANINDVDAQALAEFAEWLNHKNIPARAKRTMQIVGQIWDFAVNKGLISQERRNPVDTAKLLLAKHTSNPEPHLPAAELTAFFHALQTSADIHPITRYLLLFNALLAPRKSALSKSRWENIDFERRIWFMPDEDMKMGNDFLIPLADWPLALLQELHTITGHQAYLFPPLRRGVGGNAYISQKVGNVAIKRLGFDGSHAGKSNASMHGFRHTMTNICAINGKDVLTTDLALGHIQRSALKKQGMDSLAHYLTTAEFRFEERRELAAWYSGFLKQRYDEAAAIVAAENGRK